MDYPVRFIERKMKKLLQINPVLRINTSTGHIMQEIGEHVMKSGWESYIAYSRGRDGIKFCQSKLVPVGDRWSVAWHGIMTRFFDRHGLASSRATQQFIRQIEDLKPDIIHIHNVHGYFLNYKILFKYLVQCHVPVVWTVHDCWLYTGHCYHYSFAGCDKWKTGCRLCPQQREFPASWFIDRSRRNYIDKRVASTSLSADRLTIVPVSKWIKGELEQSFFHGYNMRVIHNGVDTEIFKIYGNDHVKDRFDFRGKHILLGVASIWSREKGFDDFIRLAGMLNDDEVIVLVGVGKNMQKKLPGNVVGIGRTENINQLAELYSAATVFINPTWQDNYPTVNMEAIACGTPVITYRTGGSIEAVTENTGFIVEQGDLEGVIRAVRVIESKGKGEYRNLCRKYALAHFNKEDRYSDYLKLYDELISR